jgi:hypothetical protein
MDNTARISVSVAVPPHVAFEIFTGDLDRWWRRGIRFRNAGPRSGFLRLEPHVGGRLFESIDGDAGPYVFEVGRVRIWILPICSNSPDHPARHGLEGAPFNRLIGLWWGDQMASLREYCLGPHSTQAPPVSIAPRTT